MVISGLFFFLQISLNNFKNIFDRILLETIENFDNTAATGDYFFILADTIFSKQISLANILKTFARETYFKIYFRKFLVQAEYKNSHPCQFCNGNANKNYFHAICKLIR